MKISVAALYNSEVQALQIDEHVRLTGELGARYPRGARVTAAIRRIAHGVYVDGFVEAQAAEICMRCLEPFTRSARVRMQEPFSEDVRVEDALFADASPLVGRTLDLEDFVSQLLELDEPLAPVCKDDCQGICQTCGVNRNITKCTCAEQIADQRWAGLARFIEERGQG
jgi:uncharacterized metal-binding protein YceD (DUF177 family)